MKSRDELKRAIKVLRDHISRLSPAGLRISASLDVSTVPYEIIDVARGNSGARVATNPECEIQEAGQLGSIANAGAWMGRNHVLTAFSRSR